MKNILVLCLNLDARRDRWVKCEREFLNLKISARRVRAVSRDEIPPLKQTADQHFFRAVSACKVTHLKALGEFLSSSCEYALILEDDFLVAKFARRHFSKQLEIFVAKMKSNNTDFLQIGYLPKGVSKGIFRFSPLRASFLILHLINRSYCLRLLYRQNFYTNLRFGSHAYIVNRIGAKYIIQNLRTDSKTPYDCALIEFLQKTEAASAKISFSRTKFAFVDQITNSVSDIQAP